MKRLQSYVLGKWYEGTGTPRPLFNPATDEKVAECDGTGTDMAAVVQFARDKGVASLQALSFAERAGLLKRLSGALHEHRDELIAISTENGGNTRGDAKFDIDGATGTLATYAALGAKLADTPSLADGPGVQLGRTARFWGQHVWTSRPGVAVHINAFNFPAWGMGEKMACALLAGVPVIEKAGTASAMLAWRMAEIIATSDVLPEGAFQFLVGSVGDLLDHLGAMDCVAFTGSSGTGRKIKSNEHLIRNNVRVNIEADSLNAAIVGPDLERGGDTWNLFVQNVVTDMRQKAGQKCTAVRRILVPEELVEGAVEDIVAGLEAIQIGDPADDANRMGPLASAAQLEDVLQGIQALGQIGSFACGGERRGTVGCFVAPTLVVATDPHADCIHSDEVFGPVATVLPVSGDATEAAALTNRGGGGLVASVYSDDRRWTEVVVRALAPWHGRVWIGSAKVADQALAPGMVLPMSVHGGPGRAGGGEELGGLRGLEFYMQRTALQGDQGFVGRVFGPPAE